MKKQYGITKSDLNKNTDLEYLFKKLSRQDSAKIAWEARSKNAKERKAQKQESTEQKQESTEQKQESTEQKQTEQKQESTKQPKPRVGEKELANKFEQIKDSYQQKGQEITLEDFNSKLIEELKNIYPESKLDLKKPLKDQTKEVLKALESEKRSSNPVIAYLQRLIKIKPSSKIAGRFSKFANVTDDMIYDVTYKSEGNLISKLLSLMSANDVVTLVEFINNNQWLLPNASASQINFILVQIMRTSVENNSNWVVLKDPKYKAFQDLLTRFNSASGTTLETGRLMESAYLE